MINLRDVLKAYNRIVSTCILKTCFCLLHKLNSYSFPLPSQVLASHMVYPSVCPNEYYPSIY